jgi:hypothetical protein
VKGDTVTVTVRTPVGVEKTEVMASIDGSSVEIVEPRSSELYLTVEEHNRNGRIMTKYLFAKGEVLSVVTGHKSVPRKRRAK